MAVVNTGVIRTLISKFLAGRIGREGVISKLKNLGAKPGNVIRAHSGKDVPISDSGRVKLLRLITSPDFQKALGATPAGGFRQLAGEVRDTGLQTKAGKLVANFSRAPRPKGPRTGPKPRRPPQPPQLPEGISQAAQDVFGVPAQARTAEAAVNAIQKKIGLIPLGLAGGAGFIARGLFSGQGRRDSQLHTQSLVAQLLANQAGTNRQGLVNAQEEKTRLQAALLALKIIEQQNQTAPQTIPFS